jgi:hypothetical protein
MTKKQQIIDYFTKNPAANVKKAAAKFNAALPTVYMLRKIAMRSAQEATAATILGAQAVDTPEPVQPKADDIQVGGNHYRGMGVQPWNVVDTWPRDQRIGYYRGGALKYLMRMGSKDEAPIEAAKGQHYMQKLLEVLREKADE